MPLRPLLAKIALVIILVSQVVSSTNPSIPEAPSQPTVPPPSGIKDSAMESSSLEKVLKGCLSSTWKIDPRKGLIHSFTTTGAIQCWRYCDVIFRCAALSYEIINSTCSLFNKDQKTRRDPRQNKTILSTTLLKLCMEDERIEKSSVGANITEVEYLSQSGKGFMIQNTDATIACLTKGQQPIVLPGVDGVYPLKWSSCTGSSRWVLNPVKHESYKMPGQQLFQISPVGDKDLCIDVQVVGGIKPAVLKTCRNISLTEEDAQLMFVMLEPGTFHGSDTAKHSIYSISGIEGKDSDTVSILFTELSEVTYYDWARSLYGISFRSPDMYNDHPSCSLSQFSLPHGAVRNKQNVPFFLLGQEVEIECEVGYGVRRLNYTALQTLVCSPGAKPRPCTRIYWNRNVAKEGNANSDNLCHLFQVGAIVSTTLVGALVVLMLRSRGEQSKMKHEAAETMKTADSNQ